MTIIRFQLIQCIYFVFIIKNNYLEEYHKFIILSFYSCDYNKYTLAVIKRLAHLQINEVKEEVKTENEEMEVDENKVISIY